MIDEEMIWIEIQKLLPVSVKEVKQSITSSEFQEGMILDHFDLVSEMSKENGKSNYDEQKNGSNGADIIINK